MAVTIFAREVTGTKYMIATTHGALVRQHVFKALSEGNDVVLSFEGMENVTMVYFSAAVGELCGLFDEEFLDRHLTVIGLEDGEYRIMQAAMRYSRYYYEDPVSYEYRMLLVEWDVED